MRRPSKNFAQRKYSEDIVHKQRTALISLSLVLIVYALAGGNVESSATLLSLPVKFSRPMVLLYAAWAIWLYFLYRYLLVTDSPWGHFAKELKLRTLHDKKVHAMAVCAMDRFGWSDEYKREICTHLDQGWTFDIVKADGKWAFSPSWIYRPATQATPSALANFGTFELLPSEAWTYRAARLKALFATIFYESTFSEYILPHALIWLTPVIWVSSWVGSSL